jgi:hypothetical protein
VCLLNFEFYEEIQNSKVVQFTRAFPPRTPPHPKLKIWGSSRGNNIALLLRVWVLKKKKKIPMYYKTPIYVLESLSGSFSMLSSTLVPFRQQLK